MLELYLARSVESVLRWRFFTIKIREKFRQKNAREYQRQGCGFWRRVWNLLMSMKWFRIQSNESKILFMNSIKNQTVNARFVSVIWRFSGSKAQKNSKHSWYFLRKIAIFSVRLMKISPYLACVDFRTKVVQENTGSTSQSGTIWPRLEAVIRLDWGHQNICCNFQSGDRERALFISVRIFVQIKKKNAKILQKIDENRRGQKSLCSVGNQHK